MTAIAIVQARMGSTRLPGKVLATVAGRPMIEHVLARAARIPGLDAVWTATSTHASDDPLVEVLDQLGMPVFRGSEADVLDRYYQAAQHARADVIVRVTADCSLLSPAVSGRVLAELLGRLETCDYVSNVQTRTFPRGLDTEAFTFEALQRAHAEAREPYEREHATPYLYRSGKFRLGEVRDASVDPQNGQPRDRSHLRWTVDVPADLELVRRIYDALGSFGNGTSSPDFEYDDVLTLLEQHPDWLELNREVRQKSLGE